MTQSRRSTMRWSAVVAGVAAIAVAVRRGGLFPVRVVGDSMEPTLLADSFVAVARPPRDPSYGSVVVVRRPGGTEHLKRVVAVPGSRFRVNGRDVILGTGEYGVAGDRRARSTDSRHYGPVDRDDIVGVARLCYWPPRCWRLFPR